MNLEKPAKAPAPPSWPSRVKRTKRQTSSRIGIRNWTTICFAGLSACWSISTTAPLVGQLLDQRGGLRRRTSGRRRTVRGHPWCRPPPASPDVEQGRQLDLLVLGQLFDPAQRHPFAARGGLDLAEQGEEEDRQGERGEDQHRVDRVLGEPATHRCRDVAHTAGDVAELDLRAFQPQTLTVGACHSSASS